MNYRSFRIVVMSMSFLVSLALAQENDGDQKPIKVVAFDYHDVIVKVRYDKLTWCSAKILGRNITDSPSMLWSGLGIAKRAFDGKDLTLESILEDFANLKKYEDEIYECMDVLDEPNEETIDIIKRLKQKGVKLVLASNMHEESFEINRSRLKPELFELFDFFHIKGKRNGTKPDPMYYKNLRRRMDKKLCNNEDECVKTLEAAFTDDLKENIEGCHKADVGIQGLHFTTAQKLEEELMNRDFLQKESKEN